jgi:hypothetical protein
MSGDGPAKQPGRLYDQDDDHEQVHETIGEQGEPEAAKAADQPDENRTDECANALSINFHKYARPPWSVLPTQNGVSVRSPSLWSTRGSRLTMRR